MGIVWGKKVLRKLSVIAARNSIFIVILFRAREEWVHVSIYSAMYLSNFVPFAVAGYVVWGQLYVCGSTLKHIWPKFFKQSQSGVVAPSFLWFPNESIYQMCDSLVSFYLDSRYPFAFCQWKLNRVRKFWIDFIQQFLEQGNSDRRKDDCYHSYISCIGERMDQGKKFNSYPSS
jgi:hypothetical protein